jgi:hypothetical protein
VKVCLLSGVPYVSKDFFILLIQSKSGWVISKDLSLSLEILSSTYSILLLGSIRLCYLISFLMFFTSKVLNDSFIVSIFDEFLIYILNYSNFIVSVFCYISLSFLKFILLNSLSSSLFISFSLDSC